MPEPSNDYDALFDALEAKHGRPEHVELTLHRVEGELVEAAIVLEFPKTKKRPPGTEQPP